MPKSRVPLGLAGVLALWGAAGGASAETAPTWADHEADATEDADATVAVMFDPLATACGVFGGEADFVMQRSIAIAVAASASRPDQETLGALGVGLLVYPLHTAFHGLYLQPRLVYGHALGPSSMSGTGELSAIGVLGWQWTWDYGLSIRLGAGVAGSTGGLSWQAPRVEVGRLGTGLGLGLAIMADAGLGWAW